MIHYIIKPLKLYNLSFFVSLQFLNHLVQHLFPHFPDNFASLTSLEDIVYQTVAGLVGGLGRLLK